MPQLFEWIIRIEYCWYWDRLFVVVFVCIVRDESIETVTGDKKKAKSNQNRIESNRIEKNKSPNVVEQCSLKPMQSPSKIFSRSTAFLFRFVFVVVVIDIVVLFFYLAHWFKMYFTLFKWYLVDFWLFIFFLHILILCRLDEHCHVFCGWIDYLLLLLRFIFMVQFELQ